MNKSWLLTLSLALAASTVQAHGIAAMPLAPMFAPGLTPHEVIFTSEEAYTKVSYTDAGGNVLSCQTPCTLDIRDRFGWWSDYTFTATALSGKTTTVTYSERTPLDAQGIVPTSVAFWANE